MHGTSTPSQRYKLIFKTRTPGDHWTGHEIYPWAMPNKNLLFIMRAMGPLVSNLGDDNDDDGLLSP